MKCEFSAAGVLRIIPENPVEQFALSKWDRSQIELAQCDWDIRTLRSMEEFVRMVDGRKDEWLKFLKQESPQMLQERNFER